MNMKLQKIFNIETLGEAMRPNGGGEMISKSEEERYRLDLRGEAFRLSREERDHIAGHALDSIHRLATDLAFFSGPEVDEVSCLASDTSRKIAALSSLLGDIGWERSEVQPLGEGYLLGELPVAQLRPWLEEWQGQDYEALVNTEEALKAARFGDHPRHDNEAEFRQAISDAQTKLGTGAILLARLEKWMASHGN